MKLTTPTKAAPFELARIDEKGIVLLLGAQQAWTSISWTCLEGIPAFLGPGRWVEIGSSYSTTAAPGTLDAYLKDHIKRATAGWVAAVLEAADVVQIDRRRPARVRLRVTSA
jgi:hypothetical protein